MLKASDEAGPKGLTIYGQEMDYATSALARMNMILHDNATAKIWKGNTLADPHWKDGNDNLKTFDFAVANPLSPTKTGPAGWMLRTINLTALSGGHRQRRMATMLSCCTLSKASRAQVKAQ